jgi:DNA-binding LytR/AlgR family response regulator
MKLSKIKVLILEDFPPAAEEIADYIKNAGYEIVGIATTKNTAINLLYTNKPDVAVLDICIGEEKEGGLEVAKLIRENFGNIPIIFVTGSDDNQVQDKAFETLPAAYLSKPFSERNLLNQVKLAIRNASRGTYPAYSIDAQVLEKGSESLFFHDSLFIWYEKEYRKIEFNNILSVKSENQTINISLINDNKVLCLSMTLAAFVKQVDHNFFVASRSAIVNLKHMVSFNSEEITLVNEQRIPLSQESYKQIKSGVDDKLVQRKAKQ